MGVLRCIYGWTCRHFQAMQWKWLWFIKLASFSFGSKIYFSCHAGWACYRSSNSLDYLSVLIFFMKRGILQMCEVGSRWFGREHLNWCVQASVSPVLASPVLGISLYHHYYYYFPMPLGPLFTRPLSLFEVIGLASKVYARYLPPFTSPR